MTQGVGIDTCVVLRLLTGLPEDQAQRARTFLETCARKNVRVLASDLVVAEAYHALIHFYEVPKKTALDTLRALLNSPGIHATGSAPSVLADYQGTGAGLAERLIRSDLLKHTDRVVSFDKDFCRLPGVHAL